jgi:LmbE family N-acetylglucosaminyl deacetylase
MKTNIRVQSSEFRVQSLLSKYQVLRKSVSVCVYLWIISLCLCVFSLSINAQVRPVYDQGAIGLGQLLKQLNNTKRVMHTGAHPDDEDSFLLAYLARGENARTVYLSLTRGDGGQNVIGPELFEPLGIIRSEELLQARTLDGAEQLFTRAFDYGYSKTLKEAKAKWDEKEVLCDAVRAIRSFRPQVVISRFSGTPADGHGQHQFAGYITPIAIEAAADANQCTDAGQPWQVLKFYVGQGFRSRDEPDLQINTGKYDHLIGRSYFEIAAEGRSQHKSQEQGFPELKGDRFSGLNLVWSKMPKVENEKSVFDGIDTSLSNAARLFINDKTKIRDDWNEMLGALKIKIDRALEKFDPNDSPSIIPDLISGRKLIQNWRIKSLPIYSGPPERVKAAMKAHRERGVKEAGLISVIIQKQDEIDEAIRQASGLQIDALTNQETVTPDEDLTTSVNIFYPESSNIKIKDIKLKTPKGWQITEGGKEPPNDSPFARFFRENPRESKTFSIKVSNDTKPTQPYFLEREKENYLYQWDTDDPQNEPFQKPLIMADVTAEINGEAITFTQSVEYRLRDQIRGELRRSLKVVPKVSLKMERDLIVSPRQSNSKKHTLNVSLVSNSSKEVGGKLKLKLPAGWKVSPAELDFDLKRNGESLSYEFEVEVPPNEQKGKYEIQAIAEMGEEQFTQTLNTVAYPHIQTHHYYTEAKTDVRVLDLKVADVKIGYIEGTGDLVPALIRQLGVDMTFLDKKYLTNGDFSDFDIIVVGIRASEAREDYIANNERLLEYVKNGGTMIVQYQKFAYQQLNLAPFPFSFNARVAEEDAKVTILEPNHPVFNFPNKITQNDFENWVQERNLYAFQKFDEKYTPLLEAHDTDEAENKGGMVYAKIGKGQFMYVSYAFFRQLPAGVPGAYRLYANILSLPKAIDREVAKK